ncbi:MAG: putative short-subunit dehydrogenase-like oxidoreductase (DUF2520 family) [Crocinitomicaceae bacterium]|jgi:predicted short-subunit dehydrogenase-like oxidoreductase (DUF2520 family)
MQKLNIIGAGKLGQSLGRLWHHAGELEIGAVLNRSFASSAAAIEHLGDGEATSEMRSMPASDLWMIATSDAEIAVAAEKLAASGLLNEGSIVFHCSGLLSSEVLKVVEPTGARVASVHPVMSFAAPLRDFNAFIGTHCGCEGDHAALAILTPLFEAIGGKCFTLQAEQKALYHAATAICCNQLTALTEASIQLFEKAGIERHSAVSLMQPLMQTTLTNIFQQGTTHALTGPIARGDHASVSSHIDAIRVVDENSLIIYQSLGKVAVELSMSQGNASTEELEKVSNLLD